VMSHPNSTRLAWRADQVARFNTRWYVVKRRSVANPITREAAVTVRAPGARIAPRSKSCACRHTRCENSGAKEAKTAMIASIQDLAIYTATTFQILFAHPSLLSWERLEQTNAYRWRLPNAMSVTVSCGWYVWTITLAHEAVEHAADLGIVETC
jgi:hypothetical protein